jgi:hypothetical protein
VNQASTSKIANEFDIYYAVKNTNTQRREKEIAAIMKKRNSEVWKLISKSNVIVNNKNSFQIFIHFGKKN